MSSEEPLPEVVDGAQTSGRTDDRIDRLLEAQAISAGLPASPDILSIKEKKKDVNKELAAFHRQASLRLTSPTGATGSNTKGEADTSTATKQIRTPNKTEGDAATSSAVTSSAAACSAEEDKASEPTLVTSAKKAGPYVKRLLEGAQKLQTTGDESWYQVPMTEVSTNCPKDQFQRFNVGERNMSRPSQKTVLMIGATGTGKTTLINGMTNYFFDIQYESDLRLRLVSPEPERPETQSQTDVISEYVLYTFDGSPVPYTVACIDTPGFGDTRGIERDEMLMEMLRGLFKNSISVVDAFCFTVKASDARLTAAQTYVFNSILSIFGKDVLPNIFIMITFADRTRPPVMSALREIKMDKQHCFKFNNCVFVIEQDAATDSDASREGSQSTDEHDMNRMFWQMAYKSYKCFFDALTEVEPRSVALTRKVLEQRHKLEEKVSALSERVDKSLNALAWMRDEILIVKGHRLRMKKRKTRRVESSTIKPWVRYSMNCTVCETTCHRSCIVPMNVLGGWCYVMDKGSCQTCPNQCPSSKHASSSFYYEEYEDDEEVTVDDIKQRYDAAVEGLSKEENALLDIAQKCEDVQKKMAFSIKEVTDCLNELDRIALRPNSLTTVDYVDQQIRVTQQEKRSGYKSRLVLLQKARKQAELISQIKAEDFDSSVFDDPKLKAILEDAHGQRDKENIGKRILEYCTANITECSDESEEGDTENVSKQNERE